VKVFVYVILEMGVIPLKPLFQLSYIIFLSQSYSFACYSIMTGSDKIMHQLVKLIVGQILCGSNTGDSFKNIPILIITQGEFPFNNVNNSQFFLIHKTRNSCKEARAN